MAQRKEERFRRKVIKIFEGAGVDKRYGIMDIEEVFNTTSFEDKNKSYSNAAKKLGKEALATALQKADWGSSSLDCIVTVSCTGIMIPSLDAYLINDLDLKQDVVRLLLLKWAVQQGFQH